MKRRRMSVDFVVLSRPLPYSGQGPQGPCDSRQDAQHGWHGPCSALGPAGSGAALVGLCRRIPPFRAGRPGRGRYRRSQNRASGHNPTKQDRPGRRRGHRCDARGDVACPAKVLRVWQDAAGIETGPIFRAINKAGTVAAERLTDRSVANIVKTYAERAGFDASTFSGHSLRSGFLTSAAAKGASIFKMMDVSRHKSVDTLRGYVRDAELFKDHAGAGLL